MFKTCEEYVLAELSRLQLECDRKDEKIARLERENEHMRNRIAKMEPTGKRLSRENCELKSRLQEMSREVLLDSTWANDCPEDDASC